MKPNKHIIKFKEILRAKARIDELHDLIASVPSVALPKKIFAGHWRYFKVRDDVLRSSVGSAAKLVVDATNSWLLGNKKDPKSYEKYFGSEYCRYFGETSVSKQTLRSLSQDQIDKLVFPNRPSFIRRWFDIEEKTRNFGTKNVVTRRYWPKVPAHMLEFAYKAAYITETKPKVGDYESELARLYKFMDENNGWIILHGNNRDEWDINLDKKKKLQRIAQRELNSCDE